MAKRVKFEYPNLPEELQEFANPKFGDVPLEDEMFAGYVNHTSRFSNDMRKFLETNGLATLGVQFEFLPKVRIYYDFFRIYWPREREGLREWFRLNYPELVNAFAPNATGYAATGAQTGTGVGVQLTADKLVYLKASAQLTTPVIVKVEYIIPPQGQSL